MAIKFYNVKTKETRVADTEPMVSAFYNSSDLGPNARVGQDMGWRLAPEVVVRIKKLKQDENLMVRIASNFAIPRENLTDTDILFYISEEDRRASEQKAQDEDHTDEYEQEIRDLEKSEKLDGKRIGETASEETERVSIDNRAPIEKASGSVPGDDPSVSIDKKVIKDEEKRHDEVVATQESANQHEEGSINDGTAAHEADNDATLDEIIADSKDEAVENAHEDAANRVPGPEGTVNPEREGQEQAEENTGADLPLTPDEESLGNPGPVDQNADQVAEQADELREDAGEDDDHEVTEAYSRSRAELNKLAKSRGVEDPESYANKDLLAEAIKNVHTEQ